MLDEGFDKGADRLSRWRCRHRSPFIPRHRAICAALIGAGSQDQQSGRPHGQERTP
jgi:hypothetical protein